MVKLSGLSPADPGSHWTLRNLWPAELRLLTSFPINRYSGIVTLEKLDSLALKLEEVNHLDKQGSREKALEPGSPKSWSFTHRVLYQP